MNLTVVTKCSASDNPSYDWAMEYLRIFQQAHLLRLWLSQVFSAVGDQLCSIAVIWISVQNGGASAGFVAAAGSLAGLALGLIGGVYADRWNRRTTMIAVDFLRAAVVFVLASIGNYIPLTLWHLGIAAVLVSALGSLFEPALQASLPDLTGSEKRLQAMNALMQVNHRLARTIGPAAAGWLVALMPIHHFFTLDAITFMVSGFAILSIGKHYQWTPSAQPAEKGLAGIWNEICRGGSILLNHEQLLWSFSMYVVVCFAWSAGFIVGFPLWIKQTLHAGVGTYGTLVAAYGVGSVLSNIAMGSINTRRRMLSISLSSIMFALGFLIVAFAPNLQIACLGAALAAVGGPMGDLMLVVMLQTEVPREDLGKVYSLKLFVTQLGSAAGFLAAPALFDACGSISGLLVCSVLFALTGLVGLIKFGNIESVFRSPIDEQASENEIPVDKMNANEAAISAKQTVG